jgi:hypothetical protein
MPLVTFAVPNAFGSISVSACGLADSNSRMSAALTVSWLQSVLAAKLGRE